MSGGISRFAHNHSILFHIVRFHHLPQMRLLFFITLRLLVERTDACRGYCGGIIGRRKRRDSPTEKEEKEDMTTRGTPVKETFWGCAPWWAQISICLKVYYSGFKKEVSESEFYRDAKQNCDKDCFKSQDASKCAYCWSSLAMSSSQLYGIYCNWSMKEEQCPGTRNTTQSAFGEFKNNIKVDILNLRVFLRTL